MSKRKRSGNAGLSKRRLMTILAAGAAAGSLLSTGTRPETGFGPATVKAMAKNVAGLDLSSNPSGKSLRTQHVPGNAVRLASCKPCLRFFEHGSSDRASDYREVIR